MLKKFLNIKFKFQKNEILKKGFLAILLKIIGLASGYGFMLYVTNILGADAWGQFSLALMMLTFASILAKFGIDTVLLKYVSSYRKSSEKIMTVYKRSVQLVLISSLIISIILFYASDFISERIFDNFQLSIIFKIIAFVVIPFSIFQVNIQFIRGLKKIKESILFNDVLKFIFTIVILFFMSFTTFNNYNAVVAFTLSIFLLMLFSTNYIFKYKNINIEHNINIKVPSFKQLCKEAFPMMFSTSFLLVMSWIDIFMLGVFMTEKDVGIYSVAVRLSMLLSIVLVSVNSILAPRISETYNNNQMDEFKKLIYFSVKLIFYCSFPIIIIIVSFPELLLSFFGKEFIIAKDTLLILLLGQFINVCSGSVALILNMTGSQKVFSKILLVTLCINILLNYFLIKTFGIDGAAIASSVSLFLWNIVAVIYIYKKYSVLTFFNPLR